MGLLEIKNLTFRYDNQIENVFTNVNFNLDTNWKLGLIGRNGKGKTTMLALLMNQYEYQGYITPNYQFDYFPYQIENENKLTRLVVNEISDEIQEWQIERELSLLGVAPEVMDQVFGTLSKGQQTKVLLAILFCKDHDFLLIDEPTNHLDYQGRMILSNYLKKKKSFIVVSHDRYFLDNCIDHVLAINRNNIEVMQGNFSLWYEQKINQDLQEQQKNAQLNKEINHMQQAARQNKNWSFKVEASKNKRVAGLKPDKGYVGHKAAKMMQRSKNIERRQNRAIEEKQGLLKNVETTAKLKLQLLDYKQKQLCSFMDVTISYGEQVVITGLNFSINQGDRINLKGKNGSGKTSIIKLITGEGQNYQGKILLGSNLRIAYLAQDDTHLQGSLDQFIVDQKIDHSLFKAILRKLDFSRELFGQEIGTYSKGQKKKVMLAAVLATPAHLFIFDEPLNYLDIFARIQIQELLLDFKPTVLFVEHDQAFCQQIATKTIKV